MKTQIINALKTQLETVALRANIYSTLKLLHEVNDFPVITFYVRRETRFHYGHGRKLASLEIPLRGYVYGTIEDCEALARNIEDAIDAFVHPLVEAAAVTSLKTDEGLFLPYGICDLTLLIVYEVQNV
jgi:hypothetical protein